MYKKNCVELFPKHRKKNCKFYHMVDLLNILKTKNNLLYGAGAFVNRASALFLKKNSPPAPGVHFFDFL